MGDPEVIEVPDFKPVGFIIEVVDSAQEPVVGVEFKVTVDGGDAMTIETNGNGILGVPKPEKEINLTYATSG